LLLGWLKSILLFLLELIVEILELFVEILELIVEILWFFFLRRPELLLHSFFFLPCASL